MPIFLVHRAHSFLKFLKNIYLSQIDEIFTQYTDSTFTQFTQYLLIISGEAFLQVIVVHLMLKACAVYFHPQIAIKEWLKKFHILPTKIFLEMI